MQSIGNEPISPYLVLVDPALAERVRATAVAGSAGIGAVDEAPNQHALTSRRQPDPIEPAAVHPARAATPGLEVAHDARHRRHAPGPITAVVGLAIAALLLVGLLPPRQAPTLGEAAEPASAAAGRPTLGWQASGAPAYLVEIYAGRRLVHAASVAGTRFTIPGWFAPGRYTWQVSEYADPNLPGRRVSTPLENGWFLVEQRVAGGAAGATARKDTRGGPLGRLS